MALYPVKLSVKSVLGFDVLGGNKPEFKVEILNTPAFFMIAEKDDLLNLASFKKMFESYRGEAKKFRVMNG